jgi:hypothetical protein
MRFLAAAFYISVAMAGDYDVDLGTSLQSGKLRVEPSISGPAGKVVSYEMKVQREGRSESRAKSGGTSVSGRAKLGEDGRARLATSVVNVGPGDRFTVTVRVREGSEVVAEKSRQYP